MKKVLLILSLLFVFNSTYAQDFKIPERTVEQKHNRTVDLFWFGLIGGISSAKNSGIAVSDYSGYIGERFKTGWNKENGFEGFVRGTISNYESLRKVEDPTMVILEQTANKVDYKWKINYIDWFSEGPVYGVTYDEVNLWLDEAYKSIAEYLGATYEQEVIDGGWLKVTITRK